MSALHLAIIDTNIVVAALLTSETTSPTARVLDLMLAGRLPFLLSPPLLAEYRVVLLRPQVARLHRLAAADIDALLTTLVTAAAWREPAPRSGALTSDLPDPGGWHLWQLLDAEPSSVLLTGDKHLLQSQAFPGRILTPRQWQDGAV